MKARIVPQLVQPHLGPWTIPNARHPIAAVPIGIPRMSNDSVAIISTDISFALWRTIAMTTAAPPIVCTANIQRQSAISRINEASVGDKADPIGTDAAHIPIAKA